MLHSKHWQGERSGLAFFPKLPQTLLKAETAISHACQTARRLIIFMCTLQLFFLSFLSLKEHTMFMPSSSEEVSRGYQPSNRGLSVPAVFVKTIQ